MPNAKQPSVRINASDKVVLDRLQNQTDLSHPALLHRAIALLERELLAEQLEDDLAALCEDKEMLRAYNNLSEKFDSASGDEG